MNAIALESFLYPTQKELFELLQVIFPNCLAYQGEFILVPGSVPVLLVAHMDTVHSESVRNICKTEDGTILMSPQGIGGDDRCGVYALVSVYAQAKKKPWLLFTCDEEIGGIGAEKFCNRHKKGQLPAGLDGLNMIIEIDRAGSRDAVYYDCDNKDFERYITGKGFVTEEGSFSDISLVAPELKTAAVNLSSGYYNAHTQHEYINRTEIDAVIAKVAEMVEEAADPAFPHHGYVERPMCSFWSGWGSQLYDAPADLPDLPKEIEDEYLALLDLHSQKVLDEIREQDGDRAILTMFKDEFGSWAEYFEMA